MKRFHPDIIMFIYGIDVGSVYNAGHIESSESLSNKIDRKPSPQKVAIMAEAESTTWISISNFRNTAP